MEKVAIIYMAHDGFTSLYTGVGSVARDFLMSFPQVSKGLDKKYKGYKFDLFATTIKYNEKCFGYSETVKKATEKIIKANKNIKLIELLNGSMGDESYATIEHWKAASISGATFVYALSLQYEKVFVIAVDTPFTQVANYFFNQHVGKNVFITWLPQSTVLIHSESKDKLTKEEVIRLEWEKELVELANNNSHVFLSPVGEYMKNHLIKKYGAKRNKIITLKNSLYLNGLKAKKVKSIVAEKVIKRLNIPMNRPVLFSFGRAEYYKGLDLVLENSIELIKKKNFFVLILTSPHNDNQNDPVVKTLRRFEKKYPKDIKVITSQDFDLPHYIMQWNRLRIIAILSRAEPFGLIPIEARYYNNSKSTLVVSDVGGLSEQVINGKDGFVTKLTNKSISKTLAKVASLSDKEKEVIAKNGYKKILNEYEQIKVNSEFISKVMSLI